MQARDFKSASGTPFWPLFYVLVATLIFGPILMPFGALLLVVSLASVYVTPVYVFVLCLEGRYFLASALLVVWVLWLRSRSKSRLMRWTLQGFEYSSL